MLLCKGSKVPQELEGRRISKHEKDNQGVGGFRFTNILQLFSICFFFSITLLYHFFLDFFYPRHLPTPTPTPTTHDPRPLPTTHDPRHLATLIMYKYYVDALQRHYDPENPRSWKKIYPSCNVSRNVSVVLLFLTYLSSGTTVIGSPLSWQPSLLSIYLLFIVQ